MDPTFTDFEFSYSNLEINIQAKYGIKLDVLILQICRYGI